jgi:hypothetical protein
MKSFFLVLIVSIIVTGCQATQNQTPTPTPSLPATLTPEPTPAIPLEQIVQTLPLAGPITDPDAELSGLAWYGDTLILLPQYPHKFGEGDGAVFALSKQDILLYLNETNTAPLEPTLIQFNAPGLRREINGYQGYEAITFYGNQVFLTIEAGEDESMQGYLVSGIIEPDASQITLDVEKVIEVPLPIQSEGRSYEAMLVMDDLLLLLFEANGANLNPTPIVQVFDFELNFLRTISMVNLEYRLTDAAPADDTSFWVINQLTTDNPELATGDDSLIDKYGKGDTHSEQSQVERLVKLSYSKNGIDFVGTAPIQLKLDGSVVRKWEGLAILNHLGFLLVTDEDPDTILAFVKMP